MEYLVFLLIPGVFGARTRSALPGYETVDATRNRTKVLTTLGKECAFPFLQGGKLHHQCITVRSSRPWCSLTHNFDRDFQSGYCAPVDARPNVVVHNQNTRRKILDPCEVNPCQNGGLCTPVPQENSFRCSCPRRFGGRLCEDTKCYETEHLWYYDTGESWGRIHRRNVERCTCEAGQTKCERVRYAGCHSNPCQNEGICRQITATSEKVCHCRAGYTGANCSFDTTEPVRECFSDRGQSYQGSVGMSASGAHCLPWNSELLQDRLHAGTVVEASLRGPMGGHNYCRNPDGDNMPWCYILVGGALSWEHCNIPPCTMSMSSRRFVPSYPGPSITQTIFTRRPPKKKKNNKPSCGRRHKQSMPGRGRIIGGRTTRAGAHPWMAAIYIGRADFCAGTLISSCWVLSAAHCFYRSPLKSQIRVVLGQQNFNITGPNTRTFGVEKYILPKHFSVFNPTLHDIVLVKLKKENGTCVRKTPFIRPICLPEVAMSFPDYYCCTISGWGYTHEKMKEYSNLQEAGVRLVPQAVCAGPDVYGTQLTSNMLCAGSGMCADACQGDSGGPLACARGNVNFLYGIISWGEGCGGGKPGVYTRVLNYMDWINSLLKRTL